MTQYLLIWTRAHESQMPKQTKLEVAKFDVCSHKHFEYFNHPPYYSLV